MAKLFRDRFLTISDNFSSFTLVFLGLIFYNPRLLIFSHNFHFNFTFMVAANNLLAKKYSVAAFGLAKKLNLLEVFEVDLNKFVAALSKAMLRELSNPAISREDLQSVVADLGAKLALNENVIKFLVVIAEQRRVTNIAAITKAFSKLAKIEKNILEAEVISASGLDEKTVTEIKDVLTKKYAGKTIQITQVIKKDILGGIQIKIGSTLIDASLRQQLINLNQQFQSIL